MAELKDKLITVESAKIIHDSLNSKFNNVIDKVDNINKCSYRNLLDNSDFTNPVNQLGTTNKTIGTTLTYFLDRWQGRRCTLSFGENGLTANWDGTNGSNGYIHQSVAGNFAKGEIYTLSTEINGEVFSGAITLGNSGEGVNIALKDGVVLSLAWSNIGKIYAYVYFTKQSVIKYVALYKGAYTAETLPDYQPKGYANELIICQQYNPITGEYVGLPSIVNDFDTNVEGYIADARALKTLNDKFNMDLLWENGQYTSTFAAQPINALDVSKYNLFVIRYKLCADSNYDCWGTDICVKGYRGWMSTVMGSGGQAGTYTFSLWRQWIVSNGGTVTFFDCYKNNKSTNTPEVDNGWMIPYQIFGIKGGITTL